MTHQHHKLAPTQRPVHADTWKEAIVLITGCVLGLVVAIALPFGGSNPPIERSVLTIRLSLAFTTLAFWITALGPDCGRWPWRRRMFWTLGFAAYAVHFITAYFEAFGGLSARVVARQGPFVAYSNYAVSLLWLLDVALLTWTTTRRWKVWASFGVQLFVFASFFLAAVVFKSGVVFWMGLAMVIGVVAGAAFQVVARWRRVEPCRVMDRVLAWFGGTVYLKQVHRTTFTTRQLLQQMKDDLLAKEVQTGYTMTYVWMANQLGHVALGFAGVALPIWMWSLFIGPEPPIRVLVALALLVIVLKEIRDFVVDLRRVRAADGWFSPNRGDLALDVATASVFMALGVAVGVAAHMSWHYPILPLGAAMVVIIAGLCAGAYWLPRKKCFQMGALPFVFRLSEFPSAVDQAGAETVREFVELRCGKKHLIVVGPEASGKTSLITGIGTELAFQLGRPRFTTLFEFMQIAAMDSDPHTQVNRALWHWKAAQILLIDDVDGGSGQETMTDPEEVCTSVRGLGNDIVHGLQDRRTVWVLGPRADINAWITSLSSLLSVPQSQIAVIELAPPKDGGLPRPARTFGPARVPDRRFATG
jgi:hypothetical protein